MSNYLRRLAEQALGERASIRPLTPPRFAAADTTAGQELMTETAAAEPATPETEPRRIRPHHTEEGAPLAANPAGAMQAEPGAPHPALRPDRLLAERPSMATPQAAAASPAEPGHSPHIVAVIDASARLPADRRPRTVPAGQVPDDPLPSRQIAAVSASAPVAPLPRASATAPIDRATGRDADRMPAPDVHIHIGRIELTAQTAPAAAVRAAAPVKRSGLDDYLHRTDRKRP
jgi:hypothetical protein